MQVDKIDFKSKNAITPAVIPLLLFIILIGLPTCGSSPSLQDKVRPPAVAGAFYPKDPVQLNDFLQETLAHSTKSTINGRILGLIVPHAGYEYSAATAMAGYKQVAGGDYDLAVILAPSHHDPFNGGTIYPGTGFQTPLGVVAIDTKAAEKLVQTCSAVQFSILGNQQEHSIEVQLPFLQTVLPNVKILPIMMGRYDWDICEKIGKALAKVIAGRKVLIVASSDLYHGENYDELLKTDSNTLSAMVKLDPHKLCDGLLQDQYQACGGGPAVVMQIAATGLGANRAVLLTRTNSGDVTGQKNGYVVGYGAVAVYTADNSQNEHLDFRPLDLTVQKELLKMARQAIAYYLQTGQQKIFKPTFPVMNEKRGVFVTITEGEDLRGCIGHHEADQPLYEMVPQMALAAAFSDPRFPELRREELNKIKIKVSVYLTNVYRIKSLDEFEMGKHGIIMYKNGSGATFLPEVPIEAGWQTKEEEMRHLCQKAGLPLDAWRDGAEFWLYRTQVFDESIL
jgi:MEMO1 family protein